MGALRRLYITLGVAGGLAGAGYHGYLLWQLLGEASPATDEIKLLAIGIGLGVCGLIAALLGLLSRPASLVLLFYIGLLGLLPQPLTWYPAAALMIIGGLVGLASLRSPVEKQNPGPRRGRP